jgi:hypothetical protein
MYYAVSFAVMCAINTVTFFAGLYYLAQLAKIKRVQFDALSTSLVFAILSNCFSALTVGFSIRFATDSPVPDAFGKKSDPIAFVGPVTYALAFLFSSFSYLNVSLVWIEIAESARLLKNTSTNVQNYRYALLIYYVAFFGTMVAGLATWSFIVVVIPAAATSIFIIVTYVTGFFKMRTMVLSLMMTSLQGASSNKESISALRAKLRLIQSAALGVSFGSLIFLINIGVWTVMGGWSDHPGVAINLVPYTFIWFGVTIMNCVVMHYFAIIIRRKMHSKLPPGVAVSKTAMQVVRSTGNQEAKVSSVPEASGEYAGSHRPN